MQTKQTAVIVLSAFVVSLAGLGVMAKGSNRVSPRVVSKREAARPLAPEFSVYDSQGRLRTLKQLRGKVVLLNFFATWCGACREEIPFLAKAHEQFASRGLEVVAVALDTDKWEAVRPFVRDRQIRYPVFVPGLETRNAYSDVTAVPTLILIDRRGRVAAWRTGYDEDRDYTKEIAGLLAEPVKPAGAWLAPAELW